MESKKIADIALVLAVLLFIAATLILIFDTDLTFFKIVQLISATAIIGGVADWYGVVSIYGKPLGIKLKTEIIISKKRELAEGISRFICFDVLSKENIIAKIEKIDLMEKIIKLLKMRDKKREDSFNWFLEFFSEIIWETINKVEKDEMVKNIDSTLDIVVKKISVTREFGNFLKSFKNKNYYIDVINILIPEIRKLLNNSGLRAIIEETLNSAVDKYCRDNILRDIFSSNIKKPLIDETLKGVLKIVENAENDQNHIIKIKAREWLDKIIVILEKEENIKKYDENIYTLVKNEKGAEKIYEELNKIKSNLSKEELKEYIADIIENIVESLEQNKRLKAVFNKIIVSAGINRIEEYHWQLNEMIEKNLISMNNGELIEFLREGTEKELQMIRVNGMIFGILFGVALVFAKFILKIA